MNDDGTAGDSQADGDLRKLLAVISASQRRLESRLDTLAAGGDSRAAASHSMAGLAFRLLKGFVWCAGVVFTVMIGGCVMVGGIAAGFDAISGFF